MTTRKAAVWGMAALLLPLLSGSALADSSYQSTTQITGGALVNSVKSISFLSKSIRNMFAPVSTVMMVRGNQKAIVGKESTDIIDLDKEQMIHIDMARRTYSVVTFAEMRAAMQAAPEEMKEAESKEQPQQEQAPQQQQKPNVKLTFDVSVKNTGASKMVNGLVAQEQVVTLTMTATDENAPTTAQGQPNTASYVVTTDAWIVPDPPEVKEIAEFDRRLAEKMMQGVDTQAMLGSMGLSSAGMTSLMSSKPGASDAMARMAKEMAKVKGTRVMETISMSSTAPANSDTQANSGGTDSNSAPPRTSDATDTMTGKLVGSMLGGWHRKKAKANADEAPADNSAPTVQTNANGTQTVLLLSMEDQKSNFSRQPIPDSAFEIPAGYAKVPSAYEHSH